MAYANEIKKDEELAAGGQATTGPASGPAVLGSGGGGAAGNAPAAAEPAAASGGGQGKPGNFVGISQYLEANKPQSQKLAGNLGGYVNELSQGARDTTAKQGEEFGKAVGQGTVNLDENIVNEAKQSAQSVASDQAKKASFQKMRDAQYTGPQSFETSDYFKPVQDALKKAQEAGKNTQTEQGQKTLINQFQQAKTGKTGGAGTTSFDQMLLQSGGGKEVLGKAREAQADLPGVLEKAQQAANAKAQQAQATTAATRKAIADTFGAQGQYGQSALEKQLQQRAQQQIGQAKAEQTKLATALKTGADLSDADLKKLGMTREDYGGLLNQMNQISSLENQSGGFQGLGGSPWIDLSNFATQASPEAQITAQNVASADEYARYAALNDLMGGGGSFLTTPSLAGTANQNVIGFNRQGAGDYLSQLIASLTPQKTIQAPSRVVSGSSGPLVDANGNPIMTYFPT